MKGEEGEGDKRKESAICEVSETLPGDIDRVPEVSDGGETPVCTSRLGCETDCHWIVKKGLFKIWQLDRLFKNLFARLILT